MAFPPWQPEFPWMFDTRVFDIVPDELWYNIPKYSSLQAICESTEGVPSRFRLRIFTLGVLVTEIIAYTGATALSTSSPFTLRIVGAIIVFVPEPTRFNGVVIVSCSGYVPGYMQIVLPGAAVFIEFCISVLALFSWYTY